MNGAFRPKGGNEVHGLFDDAGAFAAVVLRNCKERLRMHCKGARIAIPQGYFRWAHQCAHWLAMTRGKMEGAVGEPLRVGLGRPTSPYRGGKERPHLCAVPKFPLQGGMSRSDKGVMAGAGGSLSTGHFPLITHHFPYAYAISHRISGIFSRLSTGINS